MSSQWLYMNSETDWQLIKYITETHARNRKYCGSDPT